ncbi:ABC transporter substrate-binding protein [Neorhizobium sp. IRS_2294]|uniref:ABC transporter substrate-binding protein n=1 Tax=unclassified Neorhizobium TaxID=2629175 RepID=UPI003D2C157C
MTNFLFHPSRRQFLAGLAIGSALPFTPAWAQAKPKSGGTLTIVSWPAPTHLNAAITTAGPETLISGKFYEGLVDYAEGMKPVPQLAESWDIAPDGLTITFNLRKGVNWHDGKPFTSKDVAMSVMEILKVHHGRGRSTFANLTEVQTPDEHTAIFKLTKPQPALMKALNASESPIMPAHIYGGTDIMANPANTAPVGTGPFKLSQYTRGESVVMDRNPSHWDNGRPYLDRLVIRYVADGATRAAMLESGEADLVASSLIPPLEIIRLGQTDGFEVTDHGYEISSSMHLLDFNTRHPILSNLKVRQAITHCIDFAWITENIWFGFGNAGTGPIHHDQRDFYTTENVPSYPVDLKKAGAMLDEAGYPKKDGGIRFKLTIDALNYGEEPLRTSEYIREQLRQVGIDLTVRSTDSGGFVKRVYTDRDFDMSTFTGSAGADPTIGVHRFYWSKNIKQGVAFSNGSGYSNPEVDALLEAAQIEMDPVKRKQLYADFQRKIMEDVPTLPLCSTSRVTIANKKVKDHTVGAVGPFGTFSQVWLDA